MKRLGKWTLYAAVGAGLFYGGALLSVQLDRDAPPNISTDASIQVPLDQASEPYERPAPADTPCLQPEFVSRCIGRSTARTGLIELAGLQEQRARVRGGYAEDAADLGFQPASGMVLRMRGAPLGWTAEYHSTAGGVGCAVYNGDVEEPFETIGGLSSASPGAVTCDDPLATGR